MQRAGRRRWQRPALHLAVGGGREIRESRRRGRREGFVESREHDFARVAELRQHLHERIHPAVLIDPLPGSRPAAEFLAIIPEHRHLAAGVPQAAKVCREFRRRTKRNEIAELFVNREEMDAMSARFRHEVGVELFAAETGDTEVPIIDEHEVDARRGEVFGEVRLPDSLRQPESPDVDPEALPEVLAVPRNLLAAVFARQDGENRLVMAGAEELQATGGHVGSNQVEKGGGMVLEPFKQGAGEVHRHRPGVALLQRGEQGAIDLDQMLLEHRIEVADRLVEVEAEAEAQRRGHQPASRAMLSRSASASRSGDGSRASRARNAAVRMASGIGSSSRS